MKSLTLSCRILTLPANSSTRRYVSIIYLLQWCNFILAFKAYRDDQFVSASNTLAGCRYSKDILELAHDSQLEQNHRVFEANHALILEEQKIIRKNLLQEDSDNDQIESSNYILSYDDKYEVFNQIKEELQIIEEPRLQRLDNCGKIFLEDFQTQRK